LISRPRLTERLLASSKQKLTLISAPAGFGKTTLVGEWIIQSKRPVAWVSLDGRDNDPARFWSYFITALRVLDPDLGKNALAMLQSLDSLPIPSILTNLINEITASPDHFSLVLDDYQAIRTRAIQEALFFFIEHMPPQMHLVLISRTDPPPAGDDWRPKTASRNSLDDLRFTLEEAGEFLNRVNALDLSPDDIAALEKRTEGWIAGLQLAAQSMQGREDVAHFIHAFTGNHRYIVGYLVEEVLSQRPKGTLDFLLQTSILERLCGPLCDALLEKPNSQATLEMLEGANLFLLPLDDQQQWFRYHQLFADVLRARLQQTQPALIPELHRRAAEWFEGNNLMAEAVQHALAAKDYALAARIIEKIAPPTIVSGQIRTALGWLESLPNELMLRSPNLCITHAAALMFTNRLEL
jgi:LuxR family maltose regulon positive regulatory protein